MRKNLIAKVSFALVFIMFIVFMCFFHVKAAETEILTEEVIESTITDGEVPKGIVDEEDETLKFFWWWVVIFFVVGAIGIEIYLLQKRNDEEKS